MQPGARTALEAKALTLTDGPDSAKPPEGRIVYAWAVESGQAGVFLTCCANVVVADAEVPALGVVAIPPALAVGADYGLTVMDGAPEAAWRLAFHVLSPAGQAALARHGFDAAAIPAE